MAHQGLNVIRFNNPICNFPLSECRERAADLMDGGATIWQKWTCDKCGSREMQKTPNIFFPFGECKCGHVTDIEASGCNYMLTRQL